MIESTDPRGHARRQVRHATLPAKRLRSRHGSSAAGIGTRLRLLRESSDLSQRQLAASISVAPGVVSRAERGLTMMDLCSLFPMAECFGVELKWLLAGSGPIWPILPGLRVIGSASDPRPCRSAVTLFTSAPPGLLVALAETTDEPRRYGWLFVQPDWRHETCGLVLPGESDPSMVAHAVVQFVLSGHRLRGRCRLNPEDYPYPYGLHTEDTARQQARRWRMALEKDNQLPLSWERWPELHGLTPPQQALVKSAFEESNLKPLDEGRDMALDVLAELVDWADHMGGWEAPAWERARALVRGSRRGDG